MKNKENWLEIIMIVLFFAWICTAENIPLSIGCFAGMLGAYFIYRKVC